MTSKEEFSKLEWKQIRSLAERVYERELNEALSAIVEGVDHAVYPTDPD